MSDTSKKILVIGLLLYLVNVVCRLCVTFEVDVDFIKNLARVSVPITTIILLAYVNDKGKDLLCKVGLAFVIADLIFTGLQAFDVIDITKLIMEDSDKFLFALNQVINGGSSLCAMVALLSLIPPVASKYDYIKKAAIGLFIVYILFAAAYVYVDSKNWETMIKVMTCSSIISTAAEYMFIITYLLNKTMNASVEETELDNEISEQSFVGAPNVPLQQMMPQQPIMPAQPIMPQQPIATVEQQVPPVVPNTEPPVLEQTVLMPVIQQQINNQVANQEQEQVPIQPIVQNIENNQQ